jgi:hypothetical protein
MDGYYEDDTYQNLDYDDIGPVCPGPMGPERMEELMEEPKTPTIVFRQTNYEIFQQKKKLFNFSDIEKDNKNSQLELAFLIDSSIHMKDHLKYISNIIQDILKDAENFYDYESFKSVEKEDFMRILILKYDMSQQKVSSSSIIRFENMKNTKIENLIIDNGEMFEWDNPGGFLFEQLLYCEWGSGSKYLFHFMADPNFTLPEEEFLLSFRNSNYDYTFINFNKDLEALNGYISNISEYVHLDYHKI